MLLYVLYNSLRCLTDVIILNENVSVFTNKNHITKLILTKIIRSPTESKKGAQLPVLVKLLYKKQKLRVDGKIWFQF
jgi:hypothetical protein